MAGIRVDVTPGQRAEARHNFRPPWVNAEKKDSIADSALFHAPDYQKPLDRSLGPHKEPLGNGGPFAS